MKNCLAEQCTHPNDKEDIEHGRPNNGSDTNVWERDEHSDDGGEELWRGPSGGHEGGSGDVFADTEFFNDDIEWGHKELVTDYGKSYEHVDHP